MSYNRNLNPLIWDNKKLKKDVRETIFKIVKQFKEDLEIPIDIIDITLVGSNASFNYNEHSDIDIHLVVNAETVSCDSNILTTLYNLARNKFNKSYDITIKGLPIEISIEDVGNNVASNGIYSVLRYKWIKEPKAIIEPDFDVIGSASYQKLVNEIQKALNAPDSTSVRNLINKLYLIRKNSIAIDGEFSKGNLIFKEIRNQGLLQKLKDELYKSLSNELTLEGLLENLSSEDAIKLLLLTEV